MRLRRATSGLLLALGIAGYLLGWSAAIERTGIEVDAGVVIVPILVLGAARFLRHDLEPVIVLGLGTLVPVALALSDAMHFFARSGGSVGDAELHEGITALFGLSAGLAAVGLLRLHLRQDRLPGVMIGWPLLFVALWWTWVWAVYFAVPLREESFFCVGNEGLLPLVVAGEAVFVLLTAGALRRRGWTKTSRAAVVVGLVAAVGSAVEMGSRLRPSTQIVRGSVVDLVSRTAQGQIGIDYRIRGRFREAGVLEFGYEPWRFEDLDDLFFRARHFLSSDRSILIEPSPELKLADFLTLLDSLLRLERDVHAGIDFGDALDMGVDSIELVVQPEHLPTRPLHQRVLGITERSAAEAFLPLGFTHGDDLTFPSLLLTRDGSGLRWEKLPTPDHAPLFQVDDSLTVADLVEGLDRLRETGREGYRLLVPDRR